MVVTRCLGLLVLLIFASLIAGVFAQRLESVVGHSVPLTKSKVNLLHFVPGQTSDDGLPSVYRDERYRYVFENLPEWIDFEDSKLVGVPPANQTGSATVKVNYETLAGTRKGTTSLTLSYGDNTGADGTQVTYFIGGLGFNRTLLKSAEGGEFVVLIPMLPKDDTQNKWVPILDTRVQQEAKTVTNTTANTSSVNTVAINTGKE
jgi:hypothetical protein